jgi:hypothetical protein
MRMWCASARRSGHMLWSASVDMHHGLLRKFWISRAQHTPCTYATTGACMPSTLKRHAAGMTESGVDHVVLHKLLQAMSVLGLEWSSAFHVSVVTLKVVLCCGCMSALHAAGTTAPTSCHNDVPWKVQMPTANVVSDWSWHCSLCCHVDWHIACRGCLFGQQRSARVGGIVSPRPVVVMSLLG